MKQAKGTTYFFTTMIAGCLLLTACGENKDPNANGPVLPDTTNQDSLNNLAPAGGMGPNTVAPDSTTMPVDSMKGTRGNSAKDSTNP